MNTRDIDKILKTLADDLQVTLSKGLYSYGTNIEIRITKLAGRKTTLPKRMLKQLDKIDNIELRMYPNDHEPPHFHAIQKGTFDLRIDIKTGDVISVKFDNGKRIRRQDLKKIKTWTIAKKEILTNTWNIMRPKVNLQNVY